ncbi:MAG: magnetochrome domain-containing protein [Candidatus Omnitrophica bacterium]|nr:magnetochrome domain-containing protein [Candidatus Omnitrophota bacterium]
MVKKPQGKNLERSFEEFKTQFKNADLNTYFIFGAIILILIVGVYALFSPEAKSARQGNPACGMIVIATNGTALASSVAASLNEARYFLVVNPLNGKHVEALKNPYRGPDLNSQLVYLIASKGEEAVIVGSIDKQSYDILMQFGIRVFGGYQGQAMKVVKLYRQARIAASLQPTDTLAQQNVVVPQTPPVVQPNAQVAFGPGMGYGRGMGGGNGPFCPLPNTVQQAGVMQMNAMQANAMPAGMGMNQSYCPLPNQPVAMQGGMGMYQQPNCPLPNRMQAMGQGVQAAFGWGQQAFVCPVCNWRMKANRQGNSFPSCPNCGAPSMALDMQNQTQNREGTFFPDGIFAANQAPMNQQFNQMPVQQNFGQGVDVSRPFICPNCNWRMYAQQGMNEFPRCPNCGQVMASAGGYPQNQNFQNQNVQYNAAPNGFYGNGNFGNQVAMAQATPTQAPPFVEGTPMPHAYRGTCTNCHQILPAPAGMQNNQAQNVPVQQDPNSARIVIGGK